MWLPELYEIRVQGGLGPDWAEAFQGFNVVEEGEGISLLRGRVVDQAALHGLLRRLRDLGLPLVSVNRVGGSSEGGPP